MLPSRCRVIECLHRFGKTVAPRSSILLASAVPTQWTKHTSDCFGMQSARLAALASASLPRLKRGFFKSKRSPRFKIPRSKRASKAHRSASRANRRRRPPRWMVWCAMPARPKACCLFLQPWLRCAMHNPANSSAPRLPPKESSGFSLCRPGNTSCVWKPATMLHLPSLILCFSRTKSPRWRFLW